VIPGALWSGVSGVEEEENGDVEGDRYKEFLSRIYLWFW